MRRPALLALFLALSFGTPRPVRAQEGEPQLTAQVLILPEKRGEPGAKPADEFDEFDEFSVSESSPAAQAWDPLEGYNRLAFKFNDKFYFWLVKPVAKGYRAVVPRRARVSVNQAFDNILFPVRFVNCLLQLKLKGAGVELGRFVVNSTVGIGGLFDPADKYLGWYPFEEEFGQTLGRWGAGDGFYFVWPILGPSNLRDSFALVPNILLNPVVHVVNTYESAGIRSYEVLNYTSLHLGEYESLKKDALDPYTFVRDVYKQNRDKKIEE